MLTLHGILFTFLFLLTFTYGHGQEKKQDGFELVREDDDIFIYERWTIFPKSKPPVKAREVKGVFNVRAAAAEAVALIQDEKKNPEMAKARFRVQSLSQGRYYLVGGIFLS